MNILDDIKDEKLKKVVDELKKMSRADLLLTYEKVDDDDDDELIKNIIVMILDER